MSIFCGKIISKRYKESKKTSGSESSKGSLFLAFEFDRDRVINSATLRRMQQKTQVFPLEKNTFVRTRLTHSLEVQQVSRFIIKNIFYYLNQSYTDLLERWQLENAQIPFESLVEVACLLHDLGNPPFGHSTEILISDWFAQFFNENNLPFSKKENDSTETCTLKEEIICDLTSFDGNAQAVRLVHSLLKLNLTYSQIASILKYPRAAFLNEKQINFTQFGCLVAKPGYFLSEKNIIETICNELNIAPFCRFPLTYIMEAADDIAYSLTDLEDAIEKRLFTVDQLYSWLENEWNSNENPFHLSDLFEKTIKHSFQIYLSKKNEQYEDCEDHFFINLRVKTSNILTAHAAKRFIQFLPDIFHGIFNQPLISPNSDHYFLLKTYKNVWRKNILSSQIIEEKEMKGNIIISGLLNKYKQLLLLSFNDFQTLFKQNFLEKHRIETFLFHKLPRKFCLAYKEAFENLDENQKKQIEIWEFYFRCRLIQDYISGMTDYFAQDEYKKLVLAE